MIPDNRDLSSAYKYIHCSKAKKCGKVMELDTIMWNYVKFIENMLEVMKIYRTQSKIPL